MKATIHIEAYTMAAYRAIRPVVVSSVVGYVGVCGLTISATINSLTIIYACSRNTRIQKRASRSSGYTGSFCAKRRTNTFFAEVNVNTWSDFYSFPK